MQSRRKDTCGLEKLHRRGRIHFATTDGVPHNTITPIARKRGENFELDLVLRNNITTKQYPDGVYHPHPEYHHIKKENIGLIEVMGLAVLPARLKTEMELLKEAMLSGADIEKDERIAKHKAWAEAIKNKYDITEENCDDILKHEIGVVFAAILEQCGVFARTEKGKSNFEVCGFRKIKFLKLSKFLLTIRQFGGIIQTF